MKSHEKILFDGEEKAGRREGALLRRLKSVLAEETGSKQRLVSPVLKVDDEGCWLWNQKLTAEGYGLSRLGGKTVWVHRFVYEKLVGPIPKGRVLDHLCKKKDCCNPRHLEPVTARENVIRGDGRAGVNFKRTRCIHGHEFTKENTRIVQGKRRCITCARKRSRDWYRNRSVVYLNR